jgi:DNA-binding transcriptional ArsR family regulator
MARFNDEPSTRITTELIRMLNHPVRREALRLLHRAPDGQMGGSQLSQAMLESVGTINHHLKTLRDARVIVLCDERQVGPVKEKWHESLVSTIPTVVAVLDETEAEDALIRRG